jgi:predicted PhzF superfamily epimerase YddE/YHI9
MGDAAAPFNGVGPTNGVAQHPSTPAPDAVSLRYFHVLGFSVDGRGGNDAGIVLPSDGGALSDRQRLAVAAKLGFSETVFVTSLRPGARACEVSLRYFTPIDEVELCGHATIACLGLLHERGLLGGARSGTLMTRAGAVSFTIRTASTGPHLMADDALVLDPDGLAATAALPTQQRPRIFIQQHARAGSQPTPRAARRAAPLHVTTKPCSRT